MAGVLRADKPWQDAGEEIRTSVGPQTAGSARQKDTPCYPIFKKPLRTNVLRTYCHTGAALLSVVAPLSFSQTPFPQLRPETGSGEEPFEPEVQRIEGWTRRSRDTKRRVKRPKYRVVLSSPSDPSSEGSCYSLSPSRPSLPFSLIRARGQVLPSCPADGSETPTNVAYTNSIRQLLASGPRELLHEELGQGTSASSSKAMKDANRKVDDELGRAENAVKRETVNTSASASATSTPEKPAPKRTNVLVSKRPEFMSEKMAQANTTFFAKTPQDGTVSVATKAGTMKSTVDFAANYVASPDLRGRLKLNASLETSSDTKLPATNQRFPTVSKFGESAVYQAVPPRDTTSLKPEMPCSAMSYGEARPKSLHSRQRWVGSVGPIDSFAGSTGTRDTAMNAVHTRLEASISNRSRKEPIVCTSHSGGGLIGSPVKSWKNYHPEPGIKQVDGRCVANTAIQSDLKGTVDKLSNMKIGCGGASGPMMSAKSPYWETPASHVSECIPRSTNLSGVMANLSGSKSPMRITTNPLVLSRPLKLDLSHFRPTSLTAQGNPFEKIVSDTSQSQKPLVFTSECHKGGWTKGVAIINQDKGARDRYLRPELYPGLDFTAPEKLAVKPDTSFSAGASPESSDYLPLSYIKEGKKWPDRTRIASTSSLNGNHYDYPSVFYEQSDGDSSRSAPSSSQNEALGSQQQHMKKWTKAFGSLSNALRSMTTKEPKVSKSTRSTQQQIRLNSSGVSDNKRGSSSAPSTVSEDHTQRSVSTSPVSSPYSRLLNRRQMQDTHRFSQNVSGSTRPSPPNYRRHLPETLKTERRQPRGPRYSGASGGSGRLV